MKPAATPPIRSNPIPVKDALYKDLLFLCDSNLIPEVYQGFFRSLPHSVPGGNVGDSGSDSKLCVHS